MKERINSEIIDQILEKRRQGLSHGKIARDLGISPKTSRRYCVSHGLDSPDPIVKPVSAEKIERIKFLYTEKGMIPAEITREMSMPRQTIVNILEREGLRTPKTFGFEKRADYSKPLPPPVNDPIYYPERKVEMKSVKIKGRKYTDVSEMYGL